MTPEEHAAIDEAKKKWWEPVQPGVAYSSYIQTSNYNDAGEKISEKTIGLREDRDSFRVNTGDHSRCDIFDGFCSPECPGRERSRLLLTVEPKEWMMPDVQILPMHGKTMRFNRRRWGQE